MKKLFATILTFIILIVSIYILMFVFPFIGALFYSLIGFELTERAGANISAVGVILSLPAAGYIAIKSYKVIVGEKSNIKS